MSLACCSWFCKCQKTFNAYLYPQEEERNGDVRDGYKLKEEKITPPHHHTHPPIVTEKKEEVGG